MTAILILKRNNLYIDITIILTKLFSFIVDKSKSEASVPCKKSSEGKKETDPCAKESDPSKQYANCLSDGKILKEEVKLNLLLVIIDQKK